MTYYEHCLQFLQTISEPGDIRELRAFVANGKVISGRFDDLKLMARTAINCSHGHDWDSFGGVSAVYLTINTIEPDAAKRIGAWDANNVKIGARSTRNQDVHYRQWLVLDFDPVRPAGVCSTDAEKQAALAVSETVRKFLSDLGWGEPIVVDSGSGYHLWYRADRLHAFGPEWPQALKHISRLHSTGQVTIDTSVCNSARILRLPGTENRKGESTAERPHRICKVISYPEQTVKVSHEMLRDLALREGGLKTRSNAADRPTLVADVEDQIYKFCTEYELDIREEYDKDDLRLYVLSSCPFKGEPHSGDANKTSIILSPTGVGFKCLSDDCEGKDFKALRAHLYKTTGKRSQAHFYNAARKIEQRFSEWVAEQRLIDASKARLRPLLIYDEATYEAVCQAEEFSGTKEEITDPAAFGLGSWSSLAPYFELWADHIQRGLISDDDRRAHASTVLAMRTSQDLLAAGKLLGESWLVFAARLRGRPTELRLPDPIQVSSWPEDFGLTREQVRGLLNGSIDLETFEAEFNQELDFTCFSNPNIRQFNTAAEIIACPDADFSDLG